MNCSVVKYFAVFFAVLFLSGCKEKKKLAGNREVISFSNVDIPDTANASGFVKLGEQFSSGLSSNLMAEDWERTNYIDRKGVRLHNDFLWHVSFANSGSNDVPVSANIIAEGDYVYTSDAAGTIYKIDVKTGKVIWRVKTSDKKISSGTYLAFSTIEDSNGVRDVGSIYVTTAFCDLYVLDKYSGKVKHIKHLSAPAKCPAWVDDGCVFLLTSDNKIACYDIRDLSLKWEYIGLFEDSGLSGLAMPAVDHASDLLVVPSKSGEVFALNKKNGSLVWEISIGKTRITDAMAFISQIKASPVVHDGKVYIISNVGKTVALNLGKGDEVWRRMDIGGYKTPLISGNAMFMIDSYDYLIALDNVTGKTFWITDLNVLNKTITDNIGRLNWYGPVLSADNKLMVFSEYGETLIFDPVSGKMEKKVLLSKRIVKYPFWYKNRMILLSNDGLTCFKTKKVNKNK